MNWIRTVDIAKYTSNPTLTPMECALRIHKKLSRDRVMRRTPGLSRLLRAKTTTGVNSVLARIYDFADEHLIWLGLGI